jgi:putative ABC transport system permease protein
MNRAVCRSVVRAVALVTPRAERARWRDEWLAEVDHSWKPPTNLRRRLMLTRRTLTTVPHAIWFRKEHAHMNLSGFLQDLRVAARTMWRQRSFALVAAATLALGIGANTAIFSIINRTLLAPLPFGHPDELVQVWETIPAQGVTTNTPAPATLDVWREQSRLASGFAAYTSATINITGDGAPERLRGLRASASLLSVLDVKPLLGRGFTADEDRFGGPAAVLLTHAFWMRRFQADPSVVGRAITLDGQAASVVGVLPEALPMSLTGVDVWIPLALKPTESRQSRMLWVVARMQPHVTAASLQQELDAVMRRDGDRTFDGIGVAVKPMDDELRGGVRPDLLLIFAVSGVVLLIACANIATMLLARGLTRRREMAIRASLGAGRARLARMLIAESAVLGLVGGAAGRIVGAWSTSLLQSLMPAALADTVSGSLDARVLTFGLAIAVAAALIAGLAPLVGIGAGPLTVSSRSGDGHERKSTSWLRAGLVSIQMALAVVLLSGTALLTRTFVAIALTPTGFSSSGVLTAQVPRADADDARRTEFYERLIVAVRNIPGVTSVGLINGVPIRWAGGGSGFQLDDGKVPATFLPGHHRIVSAGYFAAMGISILSGEGFSGTERKGGENVAIVSESFAKAAWQGSAAVGRRIRWGADGSWIRVIGVAGDVRLSRSRPPEPHVYLPFTQVQYSPYAPSDVVIKTAGNPGALAGALRDAVRAIDPNQPVATIMTMDELMSRAMGGRRFTLSLMAVFGALALALCAIGIYGVLSYMVNRRAKEFGVRIAIGATSRHVRLEVLRQGLAMTIAGAVGGGAAAALMSRWLAKVVPGMTSLDAWPVIVAAAVLLVVALLACDIPARRAMRVDPITALRDN